MTRFRFQALVVPALAAGLLAAPLTALPLSDDHAQIGIGIGISVHIAPPVLPVYVQPPLPAPGYIFTPGYWAYGDAGYYWVPGTWVRPPSIGLLWTPAYWGWNNGVYVFNAGYWGPHVGFYGGINYGFGYGGIGFEGGVWRGGVFSYNAAVNNFGGVHVTNVYTKTVIVNNTTRVSFNGGTGGISARPTQAEASYMHEQHVPPTSEQTQHFQAAAHNRALLASANGGHPAITATPRPGEFHAGAAAAPAHPALRPAAARPEGVPHPAAAMRGGTPPREAALRGPRPQPHPAAHVAPPRAERRPEERK